MKTSVRASMALAIAVCWAGPAQAADDQIKTVPADAATGSVESQTIDQNLAGEMALVDATRDGWPSEALNSASGKVLTRIFGRGGPQANRDEILDLLTADAACNALRPAQLDETSVAGALKVLRGEPGEIRFAGKPVVLEQIANLLAPFDAGPAMVKFKTVRSDVTGDVGTTEVICLLAGRSASRGLVQQNARWVLTWDVSAGPNNPLLREIKALSFEEVSRPRAFFEDCTLAVLAGSPSTDQMMYGAEHWWGRIDFGGGGSLSGHYGITLGDVDNDGLDDVYVCQPGLLPNRLYRHKPDGTLEDISAAAGVDFLNESASSLLVDLDNDGNQDLIIAMISHIAVMQGDGKGRFVTRARLPAIMAMSMAAADFDLDGDLDFYVCEYAANGVANTTTGPLYDSNQGLPNALYRNRGGFRFDNVTLAVGLDQNNRKQTFAAAWEDFDNDGDPDLYVANDFGRNNFYRNDGGRFTDIAAQAGVVDQAAGMGVTWADVNLDGHMDIYVSNMFSSAGNRVTNNKQFKAVGGTGAVSGLQYFARGNTLFKNRGDGTFADATKVAGLEMGRFAWGAHFVDFNNDGLPDIVCPNGFITNRSSADL